MLKSLILKNFQIHKRREIIFDPQVTTIIGRNDRGKSAIIRALKWLCFNRPLSASIVRHGASFCKAVLTVDGRTLTRRRGVKGGDNYYRLGKESFKALRGDVPDQVKQLLNVSEDNFQFQHDDPFWLLSSGQEINRQLNEIVNLGQIDRALGAVIGQLRTAKATAGVCRERLGAARAARQSLAWTGAARQDLDRLQSLAKQQAARGATLARALALIERIDRDTRRLAVASAGLCEANRLLTTFGGLDTPQKDIDRLREFVEALDTQEYMLCGRKKELKQVNKELSTISLCPTCQQPIN